MPVIFDKVVGTVESPAEQTTEPMTDNRPPPQLIQQQFARMMRDRQKRSDRLRAD